MSIRPLDMQIMVPKLQEASSIKQMEQQKESMNQQSLAAYQDKKHQTNQHIVVHTGEEEALRDQMDAKEKSKNPYESQKHKKSKKDSSEEEEAILPVHRIDVRI